MAKQTINIGAAANDGTGDPIRTAFGKVNDNFTEVYTANTGVNTGDETLASIKSKLGITTLSGSNTGDQNLAAYATTAAVAAGYQPLDSDLTAIAALTTTAYGRALLSTADAPTLRTAIGLGQTDAPTFLAQSLTGQSLTGVQATSLVDLATTWLSTTGTPTAIKLNVTDTANVPAASNLLDLQVGGVSKFKVNKAGRTMIGNVLDFGTSTLLSWENPFLRTYSPFSCTSLDIGASGNLILANDAPGILAQRNGVNKQALRVYNTNLSGAPEWAEFDWITSGTGNTLKIGTNKSGDGGARPIDFVTGGVVRMSIGTTGTVSLAQLDVGGSTVRNNYIEVPAAGQFSFSGRCTINSGVDGNIHIQSSAGGNFGRLQLGGTTSAFPAIKRNGTGIDIVLANDSGFAPLSAGTILGNVLQATTFSLIGASSWYYWTGRGGLSAPSDGVIKLGNNADNGFTRLEFGATNLGISRGTGSPEGVVTALVGSLYLRTDGGLLSTLYVKESSPTPNTGWVAK